MKKIILLALTAILVSCAFNDYQAPDKYKGYVVDSKRNPPPYSKFYLLLKLPPEKRDSAGKDYMWIQVTFGEYDKLNIGDTIK